MYWTTLEISAPRCALMCYPSSNITYCIACLLCIGVILLNKFNSIQFNSICETFLDDNVADNEIYIDGYTVVKKNRNRHGGGVLLYIKVKYRVCFAPVFITYNKLYMYIASIFCKTSVTSVLYH